MRTKTTTEYAITAGSHGRTAATKGDTRTRITTECAITAGSHGRTAVTEEGTQTRTTAECAAIMGAAPDKGIMEDMEADVMESAPDNR